MVSYFHSARNTSFYKFPNSEQLQLSKFYIFFLCLTDIEKQIMNRPYLLPNFANIKI